MEIKNKPILYKDGTRKIVSIGASAVITENGKVLLVRGKGGSKFKFPGGHIDDTEKIREAVVRECREETSIEVEVQGEPHFYLFQKDEKTDIILVNYRAEVISGIARPNTEIEEVQWFDLEQLPENLFDNVKIVLNEFRLIDLGVSDE